MNCTIDEKFENEMDARATYLSLINYLDEKDPSAKKYDESSTPHAIYFIIDTQVIVERKEFGVDIEIRGMNSKEVKKELEEIISSDVYALAKNGEVVKELEKRFEKYD